MSIIAEYRKCTKCGTVYSFNPDVGKYKCPKCGSMGSTLVSVGELSMGEKLKSRFGKKKDK